MGLRPLFVLQTLTRRHCLVPHLLRKFPHVDKGENIGPIACLHMPLHCSPTKTLPVWRGQVWVGNTDFPARLQLVKQEKNVKVKCKLPR